MKREMYEKIILDLCSFPDPIKTLRLYKSGESLLHPEFPDMVAFAKKTGRFLQVDTTTNGLMLLKGLNRRLVECGLDKIFISVPANYGPHYLSMVRDLYTQSRGSGLHIMVKAIGDHLSGRRDKFIDDFADFADSIFVERLVPCWPGFEVEGHTEDVGIYGQDIKQVEVCPYIFYSMAINSDGSVSQCFLDWRHSVHMRLGEPGEYSMREIWNGIQLRAIQRIHLLGHRKDLYGCNNCQQLAYGSPDDIDEYADEILGKLP
jgi:hypothetical protein